MIKTDLIEGSTFYENSKNSFRYCYDFISTFHGLNKTF